MASRRLLIRFPTPLTHFTTSGSVLSLGIKSRYMIQQSLPSPPPRALASSASASSVFSFALRSPFASRAFRAFNLLRASARARRSTLENGLCPGDLLLPEPPAPADAPGAGAGSGAGAGACGDFALVGLTLGLLVAGAGAGVGAGVDLLVFDGELTGLLDLGGGGLDGEPKRSPARRRSERSSLGLIGVDDGDAADTSAEAHLWVSGCRCVAQNCFRQRSQVMGV